MGRFLRKSTSATAEKIKRVRFVRQVTLLFVHFAARFEKDAACRKLIGTTHIAVSGYEWHSYHVSQRHRQLHGVISCIRDMRGAD